VDRPFPPTPRRRALARAAGVVLESPAFTAAAALAAGVLAIVVIAPAIARSLRASTAAAFSHATAAAAADAAAGADVVTRATATSTSTVTADVLAAVGPLLLAAAVGAVVATAVLTRSLFVPRRHVRGAPTVPPEPGVDATLGLARAAVVAAVGATFLLTHVPALVALATPAASSGSSASSSSATLLRALALDALAHAAVAALLVAATDVVVRHRRLAAALRMTPREAREEARLAGNDPAARRRVRDARAHDPRERLRDATLVLVGADVAVAVRYASGMTAPALVRAARGVERQQLLAAARALGLPALAEGELAAAVAGGITPAHHPALARAVAALA